MDVGAEAADLVAFEFGDLEAAVGQTERCSFTVGGQPVDAIATVTSVDNGNVKYDITTEAHSITKELLARKVVEQVIGSADPALQRNSGSSRNGPSLR